MALNGSREEVRGVWGGEGRIVRGSPVRKGGGRCWVCEKGGNRWYVRYGRLHYGYCAGEICFIRRKFLDGGFWDGIGLVFIENGESGCTLGSSDT